VSVAHPSHAQKSSAINLPAEIRPLLDAPIYSRANGYMKRWLVDIGAEVKAGQLLAEIDTPEIGQELAQMKAQLVQAQAALALAKTTAARWADLLKTSSVSEQESAEKQADLALKTATVEAAQANVRRLEELVSFTRIVAPFDGTITARLADVGELIQPNKELFRLAQTKTLRVFVRVPQTISRGIEIGQEAELTIPEFPHRVFKAKVVRTSGAMTADSRTLLTELELPNEKGEILSGSFAQVRFPELHMDSPLTVPGNALIFRSEGTQLALVRDDTIELRKIALGRDFGSRVEVTSGVDANDSVVLNPPDALVSGMKVRIVQPPSSGPAPSTK
jgi:RND family efflux transporter MFP subunit